MSITKTTEVDKIEIVGPYKTVQVRQAIIIKENGNEISKTYHRYSLPPNADISNEPSDVQGICNAVWTQSVKDAYNNMLAAEAAEAEARYSQGN
jgi:hypothetical protein